MKVTVQVTMQFDLEVDYKDNEFLSGNDLLEWELEERGCPGTGDVGAKLEQLIEEGNEKGICWACPNGKTKIIAIEGVPYVRRGD